MGVRILVGLYDGTKQAAALVCSTTGTVFGPLIEGEEPEERAEAFITFVREKLAVDPRQLCDKAMSDAWEWFEREEPVK